MIVHRRSTAGLRTAVAGILAALALAGIPDGVSAAECSVDTSGVAFGSYDPFADGAHDGAGSIEVTCDVSLAYVVSLSPGAGTYASRRLVSGADALSYNLYLDVNRTLVWGDGSGATGTASGNGEGETFTVYGRIEALQNVPVGSYADAIVVTIDY